MQFIFGVLCLYGVGIVFAAPRIVNKFDQRFSFSCPPGESIFYMHSHHNNHHEDRKFGFVCRSTPAIDRNRCHWTNYLNSFDQELDFTKGNIAITGAESYHNNHHEDRRWKLRYCYLRNGYVAFSCGKTGYVNGFDQDISYSVPKDRILTGMNSYHSNKHEDRRWKYYICAVGKLAKQY